MVYATDPRFGSIRPSLPLIEEGAQVRERQKILSVIDMDGPKLAVAKVPESQVDKIRHGMKAKIHVDAFPTQRFDGAVVDVAPLPDSPGIPGGEKVYTTKVKLENAIPGLRPGMSTEVEFLFANRDSALTVPLQSIVRFEGKRDDRKALIAVRKPGGEIELRTVTVGLANDKVIEITEGIQSGDTVLLDPLAFLNPQETGNRAPAQPKPAQ